MANQLNRTHRIMVVLFTTLILTLFAMQVCGIEDVKSIIIIALANLSLCEFISDFDYLKSWILKKKKAWDNRHITKQKKQYNAEIKNLRNEIFFAHADKNALYENMEFTLHKHIGSEEEKEKMTADFIERLSTLDFKIDTLKGSLALKQKQLEKLNNAVEFRNAAQRLWNNQDYINFGNGRTYHRDAHLAAIARMHDQMEDALENISLEINENIRQMEQMISNTEGVVIRNNEILDGHHRMGILRDIENSNHD